MTRVQQLLPPPGGEVTLDGLYLDREASVLQPTAPNAPAQIYANFMTSLDGRIAVGADEASSHVPPEMASRVDWRLFQQLQAHADGLITHGGYLRALAAGRLGNILQIADRELLAWREARGLTQQPALVVASASLNFEIPASIARFGQRLVVVTTRDGPLARVSRLRALGIDVRVTGGTGHVGADALAAVLAELGCKCVYLQAGPAVLEDMLRTGRLARLYLTLNMQVVGGEAFHTLMHGAPMADSGRLSLASLYYAPPEGARPGQLFAALTPHP